MGLENFRNVPDGDEIPPRALVTFKFYNDLGHHHSKFIDDIAFEQGNIHVDVGAAST